MHLSIFFLMTRPHMNSVCSNAGDSSIADEVSEIMNSLRYKIDTYFLILNSYIAFSSQIS